MELTGEARPEAFLVRVNASRIDAAAAIQFKDCFRETVEGSDGRIVLDMEEVEFLDSSGLGAIVAAMKMLGGDRKLELAGLTPTVEKVFRLTRLDSVFSIYADADTALAGQGGANGD